MQSIAREFNLSETVFVLPPANPVHSAGLRIFTPARELIFAGHPTVGSAVLLGLDAAKDRGSEIMLVLEEKIGAIRCGVVVKGEAAGHAVFSVPRKAEEAGPPADRELIAAALGLSPAEIGFENHHPTVYSAGNAFAFVPVRDLSVIARARLVEAKWAEAFPEDVVGAYVYCRETTAAGRHFHARMFSASFGIGEDPATGSAAANFAAVVHRFDQPPGGTHRYVIEQGFEMGRPSLIGVEMDIDGGMAAVRIVGDAVVIARGALSVD
jgi:trans-2,3-dihydro-3-hydroxyanthranilate isomerase